jgi:hypothetical protein
LPDILEFSEEAKVNSVSFLLVIPYNQETALSKKEMDELYRIVEKGRFVKQTKYTSDKGNVCHNCCL